MTLLFGVDLAKAFDTVNHEIVLELGYRVRSLANNVIHDYLPNRKQYVNMEGFHIL